MSLDAQPLRASEPELVDHFVKFVGGTTAVTLLYGRGVTATWISTGIVDLYWSDPQGLFLGVKGHCFEATTAADVKGHTVTPGVFNTSTNKLRLNITNASEALHDLAALEWLSITLTFKRAGSTV